MFCSEYFPDILVGFVFSFSFLKLYKVKSRPKLANLFGFSTSLNGLVVDTWSPAVQRILRPTLSLTGESAVITHSFCPFTHSFMPSLIQLFFPLINI